MRHAYFALIIGLLFGSPVFAQTVKDQIGFTQLENEFGGAIPDGAGLNVAIVEAPRSGAYFPDTSSSQFSGKTITDGSSLGGGSSTHATSVGIRFFGNSSGLASGISSVTGYEANDFINRALGAGSGTDPIADSFDITNHSYVGIGSSAADKFQIMSRLDFIVNRDNTVAVVGTNNNSANSTPDLLAPSYNAITVGRTDGNHSRGLTSDYGTPRFKPDIVAPESSTSNATPFVSSAAGILLDAAQGTNGAQNEAIRAMLFAGATKEEFSDWDRTTTRPIDEVFGFGELNIYNSYKIFEGGEFNGETSNPATDIGFLGYDFDTFDGTNDLFYDFELTNDGEISAALTWNAVITDNDATGNFDPALAIANLDLQLYDSSGSFLGSILDQSLSTDYNHEHIFRDLNAGQYTLRVSGDSAADFGFAWRISTVPEPSAAILLLGVCGWVAKKRRRLNCS